VEVWQTSNIRRLRLGEEKKKEEEEERNPRAKIFCPVALFHRMTKIKLGMLLLYLKNGKCTISIILFITEEICSWLSPLHKQIALPFSPPTKVTAKNIFLQLK